MVNYLTATRRFEVNPLEDKFGYVKGNKHYPVNHVFDGALVPGRRHHQPG